MSNIQTIQGRAANILKSLGGQFIQTENLLKAEGSRGGKVIGHTKSGKPVYQKLHAGGNAEYADFSKEDHEDAIKLHHKEMKSSIGPVEKDLHRNRKATHKTSIEMGLYKKD